MGAAAVLIRAGDAIQETLGETRCGRIVQRALGKVLRGRPKCWVEWDETDSVMLSIMKRTRHRPKFESTPKRLSNIEPIETKTKARHTTV